MDEKKDGLKPRIRLEEVQVKGADMTFKASFDDCLSTYFRSATLRVSYDEVVDEVDPGLAVIPFVSTVITVAWATGADVDLPGLDQRFFDSVEAVREVMKSWYPRLPFSSRVHVGKIRRAGAGVAKNQGLLYSGGLDSTASLIRHLDSRPVLMLVIGTPDLPVGKPEFDRMFLGQVQPFVAGLGLKLHVARSSMLEMVNLETLNRDFGEAVGGYWWESVGHGLMLLGTCAPLTAVEEIGTLRIAASRVEEFEEPWGSNPEVDEKVAWGRTSVIHDSHDISRQQKIELLVAPFSRKARVTIPLRVCGSAKSRERLARNTLNCGRCEKCVRTIVGLLAEGINPKTCGFDMESFSARSLRVGLESGAVMLPKSVWDLWVDIQTGIRKREKEVDANSMYESGPFLEWLRSYDLERNLYRPSWISRRLGDSLPRFSARRRSVEHIQRFRFTAGQEPPEQD